MITILKYKKITIDHAIYIKVLSDVTVSYLTVSTDDGLNNTNNETEFTELRRVFGEYFEIKFQEGSVLKYLHFWIFQSPLGLIINQTDNIMELVNEYSPTGNFMKVDTTFRSESKLKKELMPAVPLSGNYRCKVEMECYVKFGPTLGWIQKIVIMSRIDSFYTASRLVTRTVSLTLTDLKGLKLCVQYMASHPNKYVFYPFNYYDVSNII